MLVMVMMLVMLVMMMMMVGSVVKKGRCSKESGENILRQPQASSPKNTMGTGTFSSRYRDNARESASLTHFHGALRAFVRGQSCRANASSG